MLSRRIKSAFLSAALLSAIPPAVLAQAPDPVTGALPNPRELPPGARFVFMSEGMATMTQQKFGLPAATFRFPLLGLVVFPNQIPDNHPDFKEYLGSKFFNIPVTFAKVTPKFYHNLPSNDFIRFSVPVNPRQEIKPEHKLAQRPIRPDEIPWLVAHQDGEVLGLTGNPEAVIMVTSGTIYHATGPSEVTVKSGTVFAFAGSKPITVVAKNGTCHVRPMSYAAVEQTWFGRSKFASLYGKSELLVAENSEHKKLSIESGHEVALNENLVASAGTSDFVASGRLPSTATVGGIDITEKKIDPDVSGFVRELKVRRPALPNLTMVRKYDHMLSQYGLLRLKPRKQVVPTTAKPSTYSASLDARYFVPVFKPLKGGKYEKNQEKSTTRTAWLKHGVTKHLSTAQVEIDSFDRIFLKSGELLVCADERVRINAGNAHVFLEKGAMALVTRKDNLLIVRNLREKWSKDVRVTVSGRGTTCGAGHEVIIGNSIPAVSAEMGHDGLQRRNVQLSEISGGNITVNKCEFDLTSIMQTSPLMRQIYRSPDKLDKKIAEAVMKMDACLKLTTAGHGTFHHMSSANTSDM